MGRDALTGSRIRERRIMAGQKQASLAQQAGISASYLNLIEHNRRRIGGKLLLNIAGALGVEPQTLTDGAEAALIATLREAAQEADLPAQEAARADEFAGRFPGWADVLASTRQRVARLERSVETLTDRMAHDPHLASSIHELLGTAAAIRSTAAILVENKALEPEWRNRFHANIDEESRRLSDSTQALMRYLDAEVDGADALSAPQEEVEAYLARHGYSFPALEQGRGDIDAMIAEAVELKTPAARHVAKAVLVQVLKDAELIDINVLRATLDVVGPDPVALGNALNAPNACVLRRLAALPELGAGLVVCDRSGTVIFRKSVEGFNVPRQSSCCPLWPLFAVLGQPGLVVRDRISQIGRGQVPFTCYATSEAQEAPGYNMAPLTQAVMLLLPAAEGGGTTQEVGSTCRICPRGGCSARREPSVLDVPI